VVAALPAGNGLCVRAVMVERAQVAWLRYLLEAHEGLAFMHSDGSGVVSLLTTDSQRAALDALIADLEHEGIVRLLPVPSSF
jgi:hypothetical protein